MWTAVSKHIKVHQKTLAQEEVWTEDFVTMYTKLPLQRIQEGVWRAVQEAFLLHAVPSPKGQADNNQFSSISNGPTMEMPSWLSRLDGPFWH